MKLLYLSCHGVLEYDELRIFSELGIDVFSHGCYANPTIAGEYKRGKVNLKFHTDLFNLSVAYGKENLHQNMIDWADVIVVMHRVDWISANWEKMKKKRVILRTIGQSSLNTEHLIKPYRNEGLEIVRYSPRERTIPDYQGGDAIIRFGKDPDEFKDWIGNDPAVLTIGQSMFDRKDFCNYWTFVRATEGFKRYLHGTPSKEKDPLYSGELTYSELKQKLREVRVYFYTGTFPASYTLNFTEALMTGTPIVAIGPHLGNSPYEFGQNTFEIPDIINNGVNGFCTDDPVEQTMFIQRLMDDDDLARSISAEGRKTAIELFDQKKIKKQWKEYLHV